MKKQESLRKEIFFEIKEELQKLEWTYNFKRTNVKQIKAERKRREKERVKIQLFVIYSECFVCKGKKLFVSLYKSN